MSNRQRPEHPHLLLALRNALGDHRKAEDLYVALTEAFGGGITRQDVLNKVLGVQLSLVKIVMLCAISGVVGGLVARCVGN